MKLQEVIDNLNRTIAAKTVLKEVLASSSENKVFAKLVQINIDELTKIRDDLLKVEA